MAKKIIVTNVRSICGSGQFRTVHLRTRRRYQNGSLFPRAKQPPFSFSDSTDISGEFLEESVALEPGFNSYFSFCRKKHGYSGVATFCRDPVVPVAAEDGLAGTLQSAACMEDRKVGFKTPSLLSSSGSKLGTCDDEPWRQAVPEDLRKELDIEGRCVMTQYSVRAPDADPESAPGSLVLINVYCPHLDKEECTEERRLYKENFNRMLESRARHLSKAGHYVAILGDLNISHRRIDHCDPSKDFEKDPNRQWLSSFLSGDDGFVDTFRKLHQDQEGAFTCWNTQLNCRATNFGTRIDYILADQRLARHLISCEVRQDIRGSDHCPVVATFDLQVVAGTKQSPPSLCTKYLTQFSGKQTKLTTFFGASTGDQKQAMEAPQARDNPPAKRVCKQTSLAAFLVAKSKDGPKDNRTAAGDVAEDFDDDGKEAVKLVERAERHLCAVDGWKSIFGGGGALKAPLCKGHSEEAVLRVVKKAGRNQGKRFWTCARGEGRQDDPNARCDFFQWVNGHR